MGAPAARAGGVGGVKPIVWMRLVRDHQPKPGPQSARFAVLWALALRMSHDGSGFCSVRQLAQDVEAGESTVYRHLKWARDTDYLAQLRRGHRLGNGAVAASEWRLSTPPSTPQPLTGERLSSTSQRQEVEQVSTSQPDRLNLSATGVPRGPLPEHALQGRAAALSDAVLAVLPDRLAGQVTRSTLEQACALLPDGWTPEAIGRAAAAASWPADARGGIVVGWIRGRGDPPPTQPASKPKAAKQCANGYAVATDGSCCPQHAEETGEA